MTFRSSAPRRSCNSNGRMSGMPEQRVRRVLMTTDTVGGVWTFTLELAEALALRDIEVVLIAFGGQPSASQIAESAPLRNLCLLGSDFKLEWMEDPWDDIAASGEWLMKLEREYCPDVVHLNSYGHGALPWNAPTVVTAHSCVLSWFRAVKGTAAPGTWDRYRTEVARSLQSADLVTAPSASMAEVLASSYHLDVSACRVIPNGRHSAKFRRAAKEPFVFTAGRLWDEAKNVKAVAEIAGALDWPVYMAGDAPHSTAPGTRMLGRLSTEEISDWYARAAIYAMPARYEPFGLSILEAALSGCALVLGNIRSLRDIWGNAALFVAPDDTRGLQEAIERLIGDAALRETMSQRAYIRALGFDIKRTADEYLQAYGEVVAARSASCVS